MIFSPSMMCADFTDFEKEVPQLDKAGVDNFIVTLWMEVLF